MPGNIEASNTFLWNIYVSLNVSHDIEWVICVVCWHDKFFRGERLVRIISIRMKLEKK